MNQVDGRSTDERAPARAERNWLGALPALPRSEASYFNTSNAISLHMEDDTLARVNTKEPERRQFSEPLVTGSTLAFPGCLLPTRIASRSLTMQSKLDIKRLWYQQYPTEHAGGCA